MAMSLQTLIAKLRGRVRAFCSARDGNVAIIFAFAILPVIGLTGAAIDYSRASSIRTDLQSALDATALMVSKIAATSTTAQLQTAAQAYFQSLFTSPVATVPVISASYTTTGGSSVTVSGNTSYNTNFMGVLGVKTMNISSSSTVNWGSSRLRVALVLDNTGSMADAGKIAALKTATKGLLTQLQNAATTNGDVYVSIVPFSKDVNVGTSNYNANWIDWSDWNDENGHDSSTTTCSTKTTGKSGKSSKKCTTTTTWVPDNHNTWNGCITDRDKDYDQLATAPNPADVNLSASAASTLFPAEQYDYCPLAMMGLNYNWTAMNTLVDQMYPNGNTNQPIGLVWGWQSLVGGGPLTAPAKDPNFQYQQIIILLSDGLNTEDRYYTSQTPIDNRMYQTGSGTGTCANIKAAGITIYTIQVNTAGDPTSTLLQNCASDSKKFFLLTSATQMVSTFNQIGTNLTNLRIAK
jgi:Flp pilus assembly protein TadG